MGARNPQSYVLDLDDLVLRRLDAQDQQIAELRANLAELRRARLPRRDRDVLAPLLPTISGSHGSRARGSAAGCVQRPQRGPMHRETQSARRCIMAPIPLTRSGAC
jgi:hypothetical protein